MALAFPAISTERTSTILVPGFTLKLAFGILKFPALAADPGTEIHAVEGLTLYSSRDTPLSASLAPDQEILAACPDTQESRAQANFVVCVGFETTGITVSRLYAVAERAQADLCPLVATVRTQTKRPDPSAGLIVFPFTIETPAVVSAGAVAFAVVRYS
jgi:hypothetical protein